MEGPTADQQRAPRPERQGDLPRAGWVSTLLLKWLRKQCNHPALTPGGVAVADSLRSPHNSRRRTRTRRNTQKMNPGETRSPARREG